MPNPAKRVYDILVVGGGIAGLTSAAYAARYGRKVLLLEQGHALGGLVNSFRYEDFTFDGGIRAIENSGIVFPMLKELGITIDFVKSPVMLGIGEDFIPLDGTNDLEKYTALLKKHFPDETRAIDGIIGEIDKAVRYMDVIYGIDNPLFLDFKANQAYFQKTVLPWLFRYQKSIKKAMRMKLPVNDHLARFTNNQALLDVITQHFFKNTPAFFALSYFHLYKDYHYPLGGTGVIPAKLARYISDHGGEIRLESDVIKAQLTTQEVTTRNGETFSYRELVWAADLKRLYSALGTVVLKDPKKQKQFLKVKPALMAHRGGDSILSVYFTSPHPQETFVSLTGAHAFYTPKKVGLRHLDLELILDSEKGNLRTTDKAAVFAWIERFFDLTTYEISLPAMRDATLAPTGQMGLIVSTLFDYRLTRAIQDHGWYEEFKVFAEQCIRQVLQENLFKDIDLVPRFSSTPMTIARVVGSSDGAITGWAFSPFIPVEHRFQKIVHSVETIFPHVWQAGQWSFSPSGLPVSVLTGKLSAQGAHKTLLKEDKKSHRR